VLGGIDRKDLAGENLIGGPKTLTDGRLRDACARLTASGQGEQQTCREYG
jgi:hypothetical protein